MSLIVTPYTQAQGPTGPPGATGPTGPSGETGPQGPVWQPITVIGALTAGGWSGNTQVIEDALIQDSSIGIVFPSQSTTEEQLTAIGLANLLVTAQDTGALTVTAFGAVPVIDLPIFIMLM